MHWTEPVNQVQILVLLLTSQGSHLFNEVKSMQMKGLVQQMLRRTNNFALCLPTSSFWFSPSILAPSTVPNKELRYTYGTELYLPCEKKKEYFKFILKDGKN